MGDGVPAAIESDAARLRQILVNLIDNAIKFTPKGEVRLEAELRGEEDGLVELLFTVQDTGIGIAPDRMNRLFKPFSQADSSMTRVYGGTGLGLAISQRLAERLGGRMWAESTTGSGSAFFFTLRCRIAKQAPKRVSTGFFAAADIAEAVAQGSQPPPKLGETLPLRILLAEDNSINLRVGLLMLERLGYMADVAGNGAEVLEALRRQPYDLVLMDIQMPGDGRPGGDATHPCRAPPRASAAHRRHDGERHARAAGGVPRRRHGGLRPETGRLRGAASRGWRAAAARRPAPRSFPAASPAARRPRSRRLPRAARRRSIPPISTSCAGWVT